MNGESLLDTGFLISALAANIQAYRQAGTQTTRYPAYALCRHQELERRQVHDLLSEGLPVAHIPAPHGGPLWVRWHRVRTWFRLLGHRDAALLRDLRAEDILLLKLIAAFYEAHQPDVVTGHRIRVLLQLIADADREMANQLRPQSRRVADRKSSADAGARDYPPADASPLALSGEIQAAENTEQEIPVAHVSELDGIWFAQGGKFGAPVSQLRTGVVTLEGGRLTGGNDFVIYMGHFDLIGTEMTGTIEVSHFGDRGSTTRSAEPIRKYSITIIEERFDADYYEGRAIFPNKSQHRLVFRRLSHLPGRAPPAA